MQGFLIFFWIWLISDEVDFANIVIHEQVGEGGFGTVNRVSFKIPYKGFKEAAAKSVFELCDHEVKIMKQLSHRHIVTLIGVCKTGFATSILMEYAPNGSLHNYLSDESKPLNDNLKKKWMQESASALQYLHEQNYLHRDIKPQNCLLFVGDLLKLCDFGLSREIEKSQTSSSMKGTHRYMAPELHRGNDRGRAVYSKATDIYAYGILILEIITREAPFQGWEWHKVVFEVGKGAKPTLPDDCPSALASILQHCWLQDPRDRPTIEYVAEGRAYITLTFMKVWHKLMHLLFGIPMFLSTVHKKKKNPKKCGPTVEYNPHSLDLL